MTALAPTGNGPFEFTNSNGQLVSIPLAALGFDASGNLAVAAAWSSIAGAAPAGALLAYMRAQGLLVPAPAASPKPAAIIKAVDAGPAGNNITVAIQNIASKPDPTQTTFDIVVTESESYPGLTATTILSVLGTASTPGSQPGLVHVTAAATGLPAAIPQTPLAGGAAGVKATLPVGTAFTLEARDPGADGDLIEVTINASATTFDLIVSWTKKTAGVTIGNFKLQVASDLGFEITAQPPAGGIFSVPSLATVNLGGGAGSTNASAILIAGQ